GAPERLRDAQAPPSPLGQVRPFRFEKHEANQTYQARQTLSMTRFLAVLPGSQALGGLTSVTTALRRPAPRRRPEPCRDAPWRRRPALARDRRAACCSARRASGRAPCDRVSP